MRKVIEVLTVVRARDEQGRIVGESVTQKIELPGDLGLAARRRLALEIYKTALEQAKAAAASGRA